MNQQELERKVRNALQVLEIGELGDTFVPRSTIFGYNLIPTDIVSNPLEKQKLYRMNSLMDLYYFSTVVLKKNRFNQTLHHQMCLSVMKDGLKEGIEIPRDHFKSTVYSECFPIWRALPFGKREEDLFSNIGYSDLYIEWLRRAHSQDIRILLVSETIKNAIKLGTRISNQYQNNRDFRTLFPEIMPTEKETWTNESMHQKRTPSGLAHGGDGTFDFIGVGGALQSRHYDIVVQDDLVGREARKSSVVMTDTIDYHQILVGATDNDPRNPGRDFDEIVVGNRWSHDDLNSYIRQEEPYFNWTTHAALGGCCSLHPFGQPIFPEAFTKEKLLRWKRRLGSYHFSCQFLNYPIDPSKSRFNMADFRYFHFEKVTGALAIPKELPAYKLLEISQPQQYRVAIRHHIAEGDVEADVFPRNLDRAMIVDPNHGGSHLGQEAGKGGRCRHAIVVTGVAKEPRRIYLLDQWAKACAIDEFVARIFFLAIKWKLRSIHVEAVAAQKYLLYHLNYFIEQHKHDRPELIGIQIIPLKTPQNADAKMERIENFIPIVERHELWLDVNNCVEFKEEAENLGQRKGLIDLLDVLSYGPQIWKFDTVSKERVDSYMSKQMAQYRKRIASTAA